MGKYGSNVERNCWINEMDESGKKWNINILCDYIYWMWYNIYEYKGENCKTASGKDEARGGRRSDNADVVVRTPVQKHKSEMSHMPHIQAGGRSQCVSACCCSPFDLRLGSAFYMSLTAEQSWHESCVMRPPIKRSVRLSARTGGFQTTSLWHFEGFNELGHPRGPKVKSDWPKAFRILLFLLRCETGLTRSLLRFLSDCTINLLYCRAAR